MPRHSLLELGLCAVLALPAAPAGPRVTQVPGGIWKGSFTGQGGAARPVLALVLAGDQEGEARLIFADGDLARLRLAPGGEGTGTGYPRAGGTLQLRWQLESARPGRAFKGVYQAIDAQTASLGHFVFDDYQAGCDLPARQAEMAGSYRSKPAQNSLAQDLELTLKADGQFVASGPGQWSLAGALAVPDPRRSLFQASYRLSRPGQPPEDGTGLGYVFKAGGTARRTLLVTGDLGGRGLLATFQAH